MAASALPPLRRIVFSRKGLDSAAGRSASPIVEGRPVSLPIPTGRYPGGRAYASLAGERPALAADLAGREGDTLCHLDPDIDRAALSDRPHGWRGAFGQVGAAQGHLRRQEVGPGDLFLFFGLFRPAERGAGARWRWAGAARHLIFGWLRIGSIIVDPVDAPEQLEGHPHLAPGWPRGNTLYLAADRLDLPSAADLPGSGVFARGAALTAEEGPCSLWRAPAWLERARMTYRRDDRYWPAPGRMDARGQWQEGVALADDDATRWAADLIRTHAEIAA